MFLLFLESSRATSRFIDHVHMVSPQANPFPKIGRDLATVNLASCCACPNSAVVAMYLKTAQNHIDMISVPKFVYFASVSRVVTVVHVLVYKNYVLLCRVLFPLLEF